MKSLVTVGTFDGVHQGHQKLLEHLILQARKLGLRSRVVMFSRPPRFYFDPKESDGLLTLPREREELIRGLGVDSVIPLNFDSHWAHMPHTRFFSEFLLGRCRAGGLMVGPDFACGRHRLGNVAWLQYACHKRGLFFSILPFVNLGGFKISSTGIRELLAQGDVVKAARLLGRPHFMAGTVVRGRGLGRRIGVPTANLKADPGKLLPPGVHRVRVTGPGILKHGRIGVCNVGTRPTVDAARKVVLRSRGTWRVIAPGAGEPRVHVEVHLPGFSGEIYGRTLKVEFLRRIRAEKKFPSLAALQLQIRRDIRAALG